MYSARVAILLWNERGFSGTVALHTVIGLSGPYGVILFATRCFSHDYYLIVPWKLLSYFVNSISMLKCAL